jgi:hypothetical protein
MLLKGSSMRTTVYSNFTGALREKGAVMDVPTRSHHLAYQGLPDTVLLEEARNKYGKHVVGVEIKYPRSQRILPASGVKEQLLYGVFNSDNTLLVGGFETLAAARGTALRILEHDLFKTVSVVNYSVLVKLYIDSPEAFSEFSTTSANVTLTVTKSGVEVEPFEPVENVTELTVGDVLQVVKQAAYVHPEKAVLGEGTFERDLAIVSQVTKPNLKLVSFVLLTGGIAPLEEGESHGFLNRTLVFLYEGLNV